MDELRPRLIMSDNAANIPSPTKEPLGEMPPSLLENDVAPGLMDVVRISSYTFNSSATYLGVSLTGKSHRELGIPCQDYHLFECLGDGWDLFLVSDGAGSAKYSERGSMATCKAAQALIHQLLENNSWMSQNTLPTEVEWYIQMRALFESLKVFFRTRCSENNDGTREEDFNATLLVAIKTPMGILTAHIGDGRMGYLSQENEWKSLMSPHKGEEANQTLFVQSNWAVPMVPSFTVSGLSIPECRVVPSIPKAIVLITDGMEKAMWQCSMYDEELQRNRDVNLPHPGFMNPLLESITYEDSLSREALLCEIMESGTPACDKSLDDKTVLLGIYHDAFPSEH